MEAVVSAMVFTMFSKSRALDHKGCKLFCKKLLAQGADSTDTLFGIPGPGSAPSNAADYGRDVTPVPGSDRSWERSLPGTCDKAASAGPRLEKHCFDLT